MRALLLIAGLAALPAHADLYRWVDPETGSVKFSSLPPPWHGDAERERAAPRVEVLRYRAPGGGSPTAAAAGEAADGRTERQLESYRSLAAELDRLDPAGAARRRAEAARAMEKVLGK